MSLPFQIALRYSLGNTHLPFSKLINRMSIIGLAMGVSLLILVLSVMNGFDRELRQRILSVIPHIVLLSSQPVERSEWQSVTQNNNSVIYATPYSEQLTMAINGDSVESIALLAIDPSLEIQNTAITTIIGEQTLDSLNSPRHIALGKLIAKRLDKQVGDLITVLTGSGSQLSSGKYHNFTIGSILETGTELDNSLALTHLASIQADKNYSTGVRVMVDDMFNTYNIALQLLRNLPDHYSALTWAQTHGTLYQAIQTSRNIVFIMVFLLLAIAAFNVLSSLMILSAEKRQDIAVLKTLGLSQKQIFKLFCIQGMLIGAIGTGIGVVLGVIFANSVSVIIEWLEQLFTTQFLTTDIYPIDYLPSDIQWPEVVLIALVAIGLSTVAAIIPAWRATKVEPAMVLRQY